MITYNCFTNTHSSVMPIKHILQRERERERCSGFHQSHLAVGGGLKRLPRSSPVTETVDGTDSR